MSTQMNDDDLKQMAIRAKQASESSPWISLQEIVSVYGISLRTLRRMQTEGFLPPRTKRGRRYCYLKAEIETAVAMGRRSLRREP